ncbi:CDP-alcohol phosphatidyltransferase family protein [Streptomyces chumphonensis]|uniref:CDP-alcohol phosphatidyltransferase family protein n=1 Tax=Streptomyces chumphonensis TaxID=1214925 RepID=A0A927ICL7_9ACTN|nr:CDP-alcohol phosphatidyltransferase family protein [Streptomyces chumphonensis]
MRRRTEKQRDAWWTVLLVDPVATPLVRWTAKWTRLSPNQITWGSLILGLLAAACFAQGDWQWLAAGALVYHCSFILDCMDGKLARLTGRGSEFGAWLDYIFDRVRVLVCAIALMGGQFRSTGETAYIWLALAVVFLDMLRYLDALEIRKVRQGMRRKLLLRADAAALTGGEDASNGSTELRRPEPEADATALTSVTSGTSGASAPRISTPRLFFTRFPGYVRFRDFLVDHRIRTHLISGIEFQMAVFIIGPLTGAIVGVTIGAGVLLLMFELALVYRLLLATREFERVMASYGPEDVTTAQPAESAPSATATR